MSRRWLDNTIGLLVLALLVGGWQYFFLIDLDAAEYVILQWDEQRYEITEEDPAYDRLIDAAEDAVFMGDTHCKCAASPYENLNVSPGRHVLIELPSPRLFFLDFKPHRVQYFHYALQDDADSSVQVGLIGERYDRLLGIHKGEGEDIVKEAKAFLEKQ